MLPSLLGHSCLTPARRKRRSPAHIDPDTNEMSSGLVVCHSLWLNPTTTNNPKKLLHRYQYYRNT